MTGGNFLKLRSTLKYSFSFTDIRNDTLPHNRIILNHIDDLLFSKRPPSGGASNSVFPGSVVITEF